ncbi:MAG: primase [Bacteroidota bacterium]|jgi:DNA primase
MARIPRELIDQIFTTARIEEVIGEFVQLKKSGSNLKGLSPFNNEKSPSFMVSPAKQIFKDFSSGKGGNVVTFLMELEQLSYPEALRWLANKYNIELPEERPMTPEEIEAGNLRESVFLITDVAAKWFKTQLHETQEGKAIGLSYFKERGFTDETMETFMLGYSPRNASAFAEYAIDKKYSEKALLESGISMQNERGWLDRFRGRVMFPIHSISGRVLGFGGRVLEKNAKAAKYLNSPENPIYHKSNVLYGLYQAKQEIVKLDEAYLVEGYTDVMSFHQNGVRNVVSSSGTALTEGQIGMLNRFTKNITLVYDGDAAGIRASFRGLDLMLAQGVNVRVVPFPEGEDPDSFAQSHSTEELKAYLAEQRQDFISYKTGVLLKEVGTDPLRRAEMVRDVVQSIAKVPNAIGQEIFIKEAARIMDLDANTLFGELARVQGQEARVAAKKQSEAPPMEVLPTEVDTPVRHKGWDQERDLIHLIVSKGDAPMMAEELDPEEARAITVAEWIVDEIEEDEITLSDPLFHEMYEMLVEEVDGEHIPNHTWWVRQENPNIVAVVTEALTEKYNLANWERKEIYLPNEVQMLIERVKETVLRVKYMYVERKLDDLREVLKAENVDYEAYMNDFKRWNDARAKLSELLNRAV